MSAVQLFDTSENMMYQWAPQMLQHPPDPHESLLLPNHPVVIIATTTPFLIISWMAVVFRLYVRVKIVRDPGWDDLFVVFSAVLNTIGLTCVIRSINYGLGHHLLYNDPEDTKTYLMLFYLESALYNTETALIKISLLFQYLRIFKFGTMHLICISLLVIISIWGLTYSIMAWIPCMPVNEFWDRKETTKCWGFGFDNKADFVALFESHTALNMTFDIAVFVTPMVLFSKPHLRRKNMLGMTGIFLFGSVVVLTSMWRFYTIVIHRAATYPYLDFTWWTPLSIILSCLEISLAVVCASMPIFWPVLERSLFQIFVTREVHVSTDDREPEDFEMRHVLDGRLGSIKSSGGNSTERLTREPPDPSWHYQDHHIQAQVAPFEIEDFSRTGVETEIATNPKPKWII